ncbi:pancreatic lipase-related protein 2-like [Homarus americanus]|uniref:Pancreatic lipase-related protein 2-like 1 n=1 Tax=Homarus americanus TaxID=6706 RepID=A0A8J5K233_HOMAM|nr:pancreatic lipase-related protein 2-like [Homarus americanus]KAG7167851.1 Pancreatic lipase-related protein 2-like 1 [Homarus americanus]
MPAIGAAKSTVLFHLLNFNLLLDLGHPPPDPLTTQDTFNTTLEEQCWKVYGQKTCFSLRAPWVNTSRPVIKAPMAPDEIGTAFMLFTRLNDTFPATLDPNDLSTVMNAPFIPNAPFKVLIHGYLSYGTTNWIKTLTGELLRKSDQNVIVVDWSVGARPPYTQAVANIRLVGAQVAYLMHSLIKFADVPVSAFHLIGHSLGSHLSGHTGTYLREMYDLTLPRITALDPAEPYFNDTHTITRLDPTDAAFVDVIHTDDSPILGFPLSVGMTQPIGHLDFFPNGGRNQPGCNGAINCQHHRAITLFTESIRQSCPMLAVACNSYEDFIDGECWGCSGESGDRLCSAMGLAAAPLPLQPLSKFFLYTQDRTPFCGYHYRVSVEVRNTTEARRHHGEFAIIHLILTGNKDKSQSIQLSEKSLYYEAGTVHRQVVLTHDLGELQTMSVAMQYPSLMFTMMLWRIKKPIVHLKSLTIEPLGRDITWKYCFKDAVQEIGKEYVLTKRNSC